jgi:hypothetical protein
MFLLSLTVGGLILVIWLYRRIMYDLAYTNMRSFPNELYKIIDATTKVYVLTSAQGPINQYIYPLQILRLLNQYIDSVKTVVNYNGLDYTTTNIATTKLIELYSSNKFTEMVSVAETSSAYISSKI